MVVSNMNPASWSGALGCRRKILLVAAIIISVIAPPDLGASTGADSRQSFSGSSSGTYLGERSRLSVGFRGGLVVSDGEPGFDIAILPSIYNESYVFCDIGVGWELIESRSWLSAFLNLGVSLLEEGTSPVITGEFGYSLGSGNGRSDSDMKGFMMGLGTGIRFPVERNMNFWINLGYRVQQYRERIEYRGPLGDVHSSLDNVSYDIFRATLGVSFE
jgi:hypothetical protein